MLKASVITLVLAIAAGAALVALWPREWSPNRPAAAGATRPTSMPATSPAVYRTDAGIEPDTCVAAWLLTRRVSPGARVVVGPGAPPGAMAFDVPGAALSRQPGKCVSRVVCERHGIQDPFSLGLAGVAQELELTPWSLNPDSFFERVRAGLGEAVNSSESDQVCMDNALTFLDRLERQFRPDPPSSGVLP